ncbi:MAG: phage major capsid protein [Streptococcaceae bacterium]|jgi:HK97 family phage major capsid protein|nr:phage major capsid protein [Streptococcaceae bacterium]
MPLMNSQQAHDNWITQGQKVSDQQANLQTMLLDDETTKEQINSENEKLKDLTAKRDIAKEVYETTLADELANAQKQNGAKAKNIDPEGEDESLMFAKNFLAYVNDPIGFKQSPNALVSGEEDDEGNWSLTIPEDIRTAINLLRRRFDTIERLVRTETTSVRAGSRVWEKLSDVTPLIELDTEDATIPEMDTPELAVIKYLIKRYGGILTLTNTLLKDTAENLISYLNRWISRKVSVTRNAKILATIDKLPTKQKKVISTVDEIKTITNINLDPALAETAIYLTNQSGFDVLDRVKRSDGSYLLQPDIKEPTQMRLRGKSVVVVTDKALPSKEGKHPLIIGDLQEAITLFDREHMSILATNIGAGAFETDTTKIRVIDRFDVVMVDDEAIFRAEFSAIEDETPVTPEP